LLYGETERVLLSVTFIKAPMQILLAAWVVGLHLMASNSHMILDLPSRTSECVPNCDIAVFVRWCAIMSVADHDIVTRN
jgi:hypothetical protein